MEQREWRRRLRFGVYEADPASGELRKSGVRLRLPEQPFQVLLMLLENPGEVVSREELRQKLWPADTFVDFDHGLNTIINKLREVLGDSASNPRYIETLARRGYRFVYPVETVATNGAAAQLAPATHPATEANPVRNSLLTGPHEVPRTPGNFIRILFLLIQVMYLCFYVAALARLLRVEELLDRIFGHPGWVASLLIVTAVVGIPIRLYLLSAVAFKVRDFTRKFLRLFAAIFLLDELWALAPFLLAPQIGIGLALGATAALIYVPFAQRTLALMWDRRIQPS